MPKPKRIHVTTGDIAAGQFRHAKQCPIGLALQRAYPRVHFLVHRECIVVFDRGFIIAKYLVPPRITKWINDYDHRHYAQPIEFTFPSFEE